MEKSSQPIQQKWAMADFQLHKKFLETGRLQIIRNLHRGRAKMQWGSLVVESIFRSSSTYIRSYLSMSGSAWRQKNELRDLSRHLSNLDIFIFHKKQKTFLSVSFFLIMWLCFLNAANVPFILCKSKGHSLILFRRPCPLGQGYLKH